MKLGNISIPAAGVPTKALGDLFYYDTKTDPPGWQVLPKGTTGQTLKATTVGSGATERVLQVWTT
jgi:hypothetical protein